MPQRFLALKLLCALSLGVTACTSPQLSHAPKTYNQDVSAQLQAKEQGKLSPLTQASPWLQASGQIQTQNHQLRLNLALSTPKKPFTTQALQCDQVAKAKISVAGVGITTPITADGADGNGFLPVTGCQLTAQISAVPFGLRLVTVELYDTNDTLVVGGTLKRAFVLDAQSQTVVVDTPYFPAAEVMETLLAGSTAEQFFAQNLDLEALQTLVESITGSSPDYATHPMLVNTPLLAADFFAGQVIKSDLSVYRQSGNTLNLTVTGLAGNDQIRVSLDDISSAPSDTGNGSVALSGVYAEGSPHLSVQFLPGVGGTYSFDPALPTAVSFTNGEADLTLTATPTTPTLDAIPAGTYYSWQSLTLTGTNFHTNGGTTVTIGGEAATITAITATSITVTIPSVSSGTGLALNVAVGSESVTQTIDVTRAYHVNDNPSGSGNNGTTWADAYTDLQDALAVAQAGDVIYVAEGTYKPTTDTNRGVSFALKEGVKLYGGFDDTSPASAPSGRDLNSDVSILSGDIGVPNVPGDNSYSVLTSTGLTAASELNGFTVQNGVASSYGGGMYNDHSSPTITNCTFSNNTANVGGGMFNKYSSPTITYSTFSNNAANYDYGGGFGGGMYNSQDSSPTITYSTFSNNSAAASGGGMYNYFYSSPTITYSTFSNNSATTSGGGIVNLEDTTTTVTHSTFSDNTATDRGGGMFNASSSLTLTNSTFSNNSAENGGGMYNTSSLTLTNLTFSNNRATDRGGGLLCYRRSPIITNTIFNNNSATNGGGMANINFATPTVTNSIFSNNSATDSGGGMDNSEHSTPTIKSSTFYNNSAPSGGGIYNYTASTILVNALFYMSSLNPNVITYTMIGETIQTHYRTYDNGSVIIDDGQGASFFTDVNSPAGANGIWRDSDDGLKLINGVGFYNFGHTAFGPSDDITGAARTGHHTPGAYQAGP